MPFFWSMQFFFNHVTHVTRTKISIQATYVTYTKTLWSHAINATHAKTWHMPPKLLTRLTNRDYPHHPRYLADSIKNNSNNKNLHYVFMIFLLIIQIFFYCKTMPSFSDWNHWKNDLFFTLWVLFWNEGRIF